MTRKKNNPDNKRTIYPVRELNMIYNLVTDVKDIAIVNQSDIKWLKKHSWAMWGAMGSILAIMLHLAGVF